MGDSNACEVRVNWNNKYDVELENAILRWIEGKS